MWGYMGLFRDNGKERGNYWAGILCPLKVENTMETKKQKNMDDHMDNWSCLVVSKDLTFWVSI